MLGWDFYLFELINQVWTAPWADHFFPWVTDLNKSFWFQLIVYPSILIFFVSRFRLRGILLFFLCALAVGSSDYLGNHFIKKIFERPRPAQTEGLHPIIRSPASGYSFVSNHAANMACLATFVSIVLPGGSGLFWFIAFVIGYSRVYNGVHFPSDVIGGFLFGAMIAWFYANLGKKLLLRR